MLVLLERGIFYGEKDIYDIYCWSSYFTFVFYYTTKADTCNIILYLNNSLAGNTIFYWNVIIFNLFDSVPSYNGPQQWREFLARRRRFISFYKGELFNEDLYEVY